jgi:hypothetical protein
LKKPNSTAAAAGKYEFEMTSGTAIFIEWIPRADGQRYG